MISGFVFPHLVYAVDTNYVADKFIGGVKEIVTSPLEYGTNINKRMNDEEQDNKLLGFFVGLVDGTGHALNKVFSGIGNILTCPFKAEE